LTAVWKLLFEGAAVEVDGIVDVVAPSAVIAVNKGTLGTFSVLTFLVDGVDVAGADADDGATDLFLEKAMPLVVVVAVLVVVVVALIFALPLCLSWFVLV